MTQALTLTRDLAQVPTPQLVLRLVGLEFGGLLRRAARAMGMARPRALTPAQLAIPDSELARKATALARAIEPDFVFNHSVRTYLFGVAIGQNLGLRADRELLYLASVLHDVGLAPEHASEGSFELDSARVAHEFVLAEGLDEARGALVHEAVALHSSMGIAGSREPEIALTHFGAGLDVIGFHREDVADETREDIVRAWPRADFKAKFSALLADHVVHRPSCHIAGPMKVGFAKKIHGAPFDH